MTASLLASCGSDAGSDVEYTLPPTDDSLTFDCPTDVTSHVDFTMPPTEVVLRPADAVVRARLIRFTEVGRWTLEAEIDVTELLVEPAGPPADPIGPGRLAVGAYDDPCSRDGRRTGLRFTEGDEVLVVLRWVGPSNTTWDAPWQAFPVLAEDADGSVRFLDTQQRLNERINDILDEPTIAGLLRAVCSGCYP